MRMHQTCKRKEKLLILLLFPLLSFFFLPRVLWTFQNVPIEFLENEQYYETLKRYLDSAKNEIVVCMFLFKTKRGSRDRATEIAKYLINAKKKNVNVKVILEYDARQDVGVVRDNMRTAVWLRENNIEVVFDAPRKRTHAKIFVIDRRYVFLGSHNITHSALKYNNETSFLIDSPEMAQKILSYIQSIGKM